jgi:BNR repeat-containing family member
MSHRVSSARHTVPMRKTPMRKTLCGLIAAGLILSFAAPAHAATELVPFRMDASNQAGWWRPIEEFNGRIFVAYNAWGSPTDSGPTDTHTVYIAKRELDGTWTRGCMKTSTGECAVFSDDVGHHQPTIAIDGDGYIHAFVSMHSINWRYYRSDVPGDVTTMVNRSSQMPDQGGNYTYPNATRTDDGDVYLIVRAGMVGRLYRWNNAVNSWSRAATFASDPNFVVYPDDVIGSDGDVHIAWEWAYGGAGGLRHLGSYLRYSPATGQFRNAAGTAVATPVNTLSPVVYQPIEGQETSTGRGDAPGVQSAKLSFHPSSHRPVVAYRYRSTTGGPFRVRLAEWTGSAWARSVVYAGAYDTFAAVDVTTFGTAGIRVYYAKNQTIADDHAFVATRQSDGTWTESLLLSGVPIERLAVTRRGATDHLYLASPSTHQLFYGTRDW